MNGKKRLSITIVILVPVFILGALAAVILERQTGEQEDE